ncbi:hypothetical protein KBB96_13675 [Luteolibacter ambystomatis]|uniref:Uncharacterized protein n=1 Tax=Luteolibacter ambystomatis TaxID=2824561 RepID=A0A975G6D2_9BACT|nr:hypothetical protein [Luteolibacter ambystomatis]QUE49914.1 hypothetical protein KBB96_13675 [Luteolibacter ambystomatis]
MTPQEKINRLTRGNRAPSPLAPEMLPVSVAPQRADFRHEVRSSAAAPVISAAVPSETVAVVPDTRHRDERGSLLWRLSLVGFILLTCGAALYVWMAASN